jgi:hypothetical protein
MMITMAIESDGRDLFVVFDGKRIAKRGHPGTPQAKTWVSLEPGFEVYDGEQHDTGEGTVVVIRNGVIVQ